MFDFLAPIFAAVGVAAAAVPIVLHMLRRTPSQKVAFSLVRFLRPSLPKTTRRSTIEHWPLLLLRILALVLIGLAFARPFQRLALPGPDRDGASDRVILLIDSSASMRRDGIRDEVVRQIRSVVAELKDVDAFSIMVYSSAVRTLVSAEEWAASEPGARTALVEQAIDGWEPDWLETRTGTALLAAAEEVSRETAASDRVGQRRIVLVTDFQRGSQLNELKSARWPTAVRVDLRLVQATATGNAGISLAADDREGRTRVRLISSADSQRSDFSLQPFDSEGTPIGNPLKAEVVPGQGRFVVIPAGDEGTARLIAGVELVQDPHPFDNVVDLPLTESPVVRVAHVGPADFNNAELMRYYLQRAIDGNETEAVQVLDMQSADGVVLPVPEDVRLVVVTDVVPEGLLASIGSCLDRGGVLLAVIRSPEVALSISSLLPEPVEVTEAEIRDYAMLGQVDFQSPLFSAFADARFSDFSSIRFWHHRQLKVTDNSSVWRSVARFDSGAPAILESSAASRRRILLFASGWHPDDSQWALSTRFAPMLTNLIRQANPRRAGQVLRTVGETIVPSELLGSDDWTVTLPNREQLTAESVRQRQSPGASVTEQKAPAAAESPAEGGGSGAAEGSGTVETENPGLLLDQPGRYVLTGRTADGDKSLNLIAGLSSQETRTDPLPVGQLQALGLDADVAKDTVPASAAETAAIASQLNSSELESRQKFWRWLLLAGLGCLMLEGLLAGSLERRQRLENAT